nr:hypothetical protein [Tanacetum cinerariifolium]
SATVVSAAPDTSSLGASTFSVESQAKPVSTAPRFTDSTVITTATMDSAVTHRKVGVSPFAYSAANASPFLSSIAGGPTPSNVFDVSAAPTEFFLDSDEEMPLGVSRVAAEPNFDDEVITEILFRGQSICGDRVDDWIVSSWTLYTKSTVYVLDLTNGKTVYMFMGSSYPIRAMLLERMLHHRLTVPPSYCRHVRVGGIIVGTMAGTIIRTVQADLLQATMPVSSAPMS